ncbi:TRAP transporter large permease subunit [Marivibrio halodurans]|uniref:TRAP transporter large permease protein n=1 Tax=Marivibrio halodurans TaxID=2039722 RepID=A0A8J7S371_9PROT|nr:TRAP transporter large permease subunit [Marivibrio halodurans]MBP5857743.1 TRAP transporter large permease subunit [Marivibrio halodurans]
MTEILLSAGVVALLFALLAMGVWVAFALFLVGALSLLVFSNAPLGTVLATSTWGASNSWALAALPLFIWMGEILFRSKLSDNLFSGLAPWLTRLPGRLLHVNVFACAVFAAVSGSSAATAATVGKISIPELTKRGYSERMMIGTLAGSATLGLLIPPSIILIVYGVATEQSIARLFVAGVLPGVLLVLLFSGFIVAWALVNRARVPSQEDRTSLAERLRAGRELLPVMLLILGVIGSVYLGIASPTDAAAVGVVIALILAWRSGDLSWTSFRDGLMGAVRTSCMITFILAGAAFLTTAMGFAGIPRMLAAWIGDMGLSANELLVALTIFFVVMGCFLDGISIIVLTTSIIMPIVEQAGIDPIWFGIYLVFVVEMSQITPPVGFNLFVLQSLTGRNILQVAWAALPFFLLMGGAIVILTAVPDLALYLPSLMGR